MVSVLLPLFFLNLFSFFNLLGIKKELLTNQIIFFLIALCFFFIARKIGVFFFKSNARFFYWLFVALLLLTYLIGDEVRGSRRWIDFYVFNFQSSEFFKIFFVIFFADFFTRYRKDLEDPKIFFKSILYFLLPTFIIFRQPDLGNALVYVVIYFSILFFSAVPKRYILYVLITSILLLPSSWFFLHDYQKDRIVSFINPDLHYQSTGYNMIQAVITAGSGKFLGKGLGYGTQSKLFFLPENHTDFAFSSMIEQFGFVGGMIVLSLYFFVVFKLVQKTLIYLQTKDDEHLFVFYFLIGFFSYFVFQMLINIGMNVGLVPVVGIALPLMSYGGSSLVSLFFAFGLIP